MGTSADVERRRRCGETPRLGECDGVTDTGTRGSNDGRTPAVSKLCSLLFGFRVRLSSCLCACVTHFIHGVVICLPNETLRAPSITSAPDLLKGGCRFTDFCLLCTIMFFKIIIKEHILKIAGALSAKLYMQLLHYQTR